MPHDPFASTLDSPTAPAEKCFAIVPHDATELPEVTKALFVGQGGDVALVPCRGDEPVIFRNVADGAILDVRVRAVHATGTTAGHLVGLA